VGPDGLESQPVYVRSAKSDGTDGGYRLWVTTRADKRTAAHRFQRGIGASWAVPCGVVHGSSWRVDPSEQERTFARDIHISCPLPLTGINAPTAPHAPPTGNRPTCPNSPLKTVRKPSLSALVVTRAYIRRRCRRSCRPYVHWLRLRVHPDPTPASPPLASSPRARRPRIPGRESLSSGAVSGTSSRASSMGLEVQEPIAPLGSSTSSWATADTTSSSAARARWQNVKTRCASPSYLGAYAQFRTAHTAWRCAGLWRASSTERRRRGQPCGSPSVRGKTNGSALHMSLTFPHRTQPNSSAFPHNTFSPSTASRKPSPIPRPTSSGTMSNS